MDFFKKFVTFLIVAIIFAVGGYFVGRGVTSDQEAALYKAPVTKTPAGLSHLSWGSNTCRIQQWDATNNTWKTVGTLDGVKERDCHDLPPPKENAAGQIKSTTTDTSAGIAKGDVTTYAGVINMGWIDGIGCNIFRWDDDTKSWKSLGIANGMKQENCKPLPPRPGTPLTPSSTVKTPVKTQ